MNLFLDSRNPSSAGGCDRRPTAGRLAFVLALSVLVGACDDPDLIRLPGCTTCASGDFVVGAVVRGDRREFELMSGGGRLIVAETKIVLLDERYRSVGSIRPGGTILSVSVGDDDTIYVAHADRIAAFSSDGEQVWSRPVAELSADEVVDRIFVEASGDFLYTFATFRSSTAEFTVRDRFEGRIRDSSTTAPGCCGSLFSAFSGVEAEPSGTVVAFVMKEVLRQFGVDVSSVTTERAMARFDGFGAIHLVSEPPVAGLPASATTTLREGGSVAFWVQLAEATTDLAGVAVDFPARAVIAGVLAPDGALRWVTRLDAQPRSGTASTGLVEFVDEDAIVVGWSIRPGASMDLLRLDSGTRSWAHAISTRFSIQFSWSAVRAPDGRFVVHVGLPGDKDTPDAPETPNRLFLDGERLVTAVGEGVLEFLP